MNNGMSMIKEITMGLVYGCKYFIQINMRYFANVVTIALPYVMYVWGQYVAMGKEGFAIGIEAFVPALVMLAVHYLREAANLSNKGYRIPVPSERFTKTSDDGEVTVERNRLQEMMLYMADLEDWLHSKGML